MANPRPKPHPKGYKFPLYKPGVATIEPLPDDVLAALFEQAVLTRPKGEPYIDGLRRYSRLLEAEIQGRLERS